jgi:FMN-dependent NADH-azoreductase
MAKLIHIQASPRGNRSASQAVASCFIKSYHTAHPGDIFDTLDLWQTDLPEINGATLDAPHTPSSIANRARRSNSTSGRPSCASSTISSLPTNTSFRYRCGISIPYKLKHYIDLLVYRGLTFSLTPEEGLQRARHGQTACSSLCGAYGPGSGAEGSDQQGKYLKHIFGFIGFTDIREIFVEPTEANPTSKDEAVAAASHKAAEMAAHF